MYLCLTLSSECMPVYILCTVVKYEIWFCCCYSFVLVQHGTSCVNLRLERIIISKYLSRTKLNCPPPSRPCMVKVRTSTISEKFIEFNNQIMPFEMEEVFFKGVNFNNHYRVLGDKEKKISVCDFIITCQAIFKFKKKNSCWYKRYHLQRKKSVVAFKSEKYLLRLFITCKYILFSRLRLFNSKTCDDLTDKKKFKSFNMFASLR